MNRPALSGHSDATALRGSVAHFAGHAAEDIVARHYAGLGLVVAHMRWRGKAGEIDLILRDGDGFVFVEVKQASSHDAAADRIGKRQARRIFAAAEEFLGRSGAGLLTPCRFDAALVDGTGRVALRENALADMI